MDLYVSPWQPTSIERFIQSRRTGTDVVRVGTNQGEGFLKALGNKAGPHALACEWVGTHLAHLIGLPTFDFAILEVAPVVDITFASGRKLSPGPAFITRAEPGRSWDSTEEGLADVANLTDIAGMMVFDNWVRNCDRHPPDLTARKPNYDNVFLSREGAPPNKVLLKVMDHSHCLTCGRDLTRHVADIGLVQDERIYGLFPAFASVMQRDASYRIAAEQTAARIAAVGPAELEEIVASVPAAWEVDTEARRAVVEFLRQRALFLKDRVVDLLWKQQEIKFDQGAINHE